MTMKMTKHAQIERYDRICAIVDMFNGDIGETLITRPVTGDPSKIQKLTTKGVVIIQAADSNTLITMYLCGPSKAKFFGASSGKMLTRAMWKRIYDNQKYQALTA